MDAADSAVFVAAAVARAQIRAMGMVAENKYREINGEPPMYRQADFDALIVDEGIHHNAVVAVLNSVY